MDFCCICEASGSDVHVDDVFSFCVSFLCSPSAVGFSGRVPGNPFQGQSRPPARVAAAALQARSATNLRFCRGRAWLYRMGGGLRPCMKQSEVII